mgnify:FL=1
MEMIPMREAMQQRHSVRSYLSTPIPQDVLTTLRQAVKECSSAAKMRIQLVTDEPEAFRGFLARRGHFVGVRNYIAFVGQKDDTLDERTGYYGERLVLLAQQLGLNTCWVAATYRKKKCPAVVNPGEKLVCVIALGYGLWRGKPHTGRPATELSNLTAASPDWFRCGMEAVLLAPTARNQQRFFFQQSGDAVSVRSTGGSYSKIDLGIVKHHFELGAGAENFRWADAPQPVSEEAAIAEAETECAVEAETEENV